MTTVVLSAFGESSSLFEKKKKKKKKSNDDDETIIKMGAASVQFMITAAMREVLTTQLQFLDEEVDEMTRWMIGQTGDVDTQSSAWLNVEDAGTSSSSGSTTATGAPQPKQRAQPKEHAGKFVMAKLRRE